MSRCETETHTFLFLSLCEAQAQQPGVVCDQSLMYHFRYLAAIRCPGVTIRYECASLPVWV